MSIHVWSGHDGSIRRKVEHFCIIWILDQDQELHFQ